MAISAEPQAGQHSTSRWLSTAEVGNCIRSAGPIFQVLPPGHQARTDIISFRLQPPTTAGEKSSAPFGLKVYNEWLKGDHALLGLSFSQSTASFELDVGPSSHLRDEIELRNTLASLSALALEAAVEQHLTEGGDERLSLSSGGNLYHCPPRPVPGAIIRGTCTCSPPSRHALDAACARLKNIWDGIEDFGEAFDDVRHRISAALGLQIQHHIVLHPSGTDAEYTPLVIGTSSAKALGCSGVVNVVVGVGEVGSNTPKAAGGRHFSKFMPNGGADSSKALVDDFPEGTKVLELKARLADGEAVPDFEQQVMNAIEDISACSEKPFFIVHAVDGSKLGARVTNHKLVTDIQAKLGKRVLIVLDACQGRTESEELDWYLSHGAVVLMTASKFYGAPGFCGMAVVPDSAASLLKKGASIPPGLSDYLTKYHVPSSLEALHEALPAQPINVGLLLRWTCGVVEMERMAHAGPSGREGIRRWVYAVKDLIRREHPNLELMSESSCAISQASQLGGVNSIISFKLLAGENRTALGTAVLKQIHRYLVKDVSGLLPNSADEDERRAAAAICFIGQPVDVGDFAVLRLAIGAALAAALGGNPRGLEMALKEDKRVLDKIEVPLKYYEVM
ncbi:hypothetical protein B0T26DRAFT_700616 [Lasiosphaeria miniovina]|uniref:Uncharacterized protein n=1 Tax=Lasiosphaeria miniovina TaxID=1954250 RepID=A0AA40ATT3_9PEZI|nr:uncharacterized protein B0T26DRAFT_700616 [Lasiosphaeria miniovina]KAK0721892.1 hypothetical protein B0T26DRAFT_700616 [Lasiosphaeria miniovina]